MSPLKVIPYDNFDDIVIDDGMGLPITHTGSTSLYTPFHTFFLNNVLYVSTMKKNLISIPQFFKSNVAIITFSPFTFQVKDPHMREILL